MRFKTALLFSIMLLHGDFMQHRCRGERLDIAKVDSDTKEEVLFLAKNAKPFEEVAQNPVFLKTLPYLHYLCSAMLRRPTGRGAPSPSPAANRHLLSTRAKREVFAARGRNSSMGVTYLRDWVRKQMVGRISHSRMEIIQSVMTGMCSKIYSLPEGRYLLHTHSIRYNPDSTYNNQTGVFTPVPDDKSDLFVDLETELKNIHGNPNTNSRDTTHPEDDGQGKNKTRQNVNIPHSPVTLESGMLEQADETIANISPQKLPKLVPKSEEYMKKSEREIVPKTDQEKVLKELEPTPNSHLETDVLQNRENNNTAQNINITELPAQLSTEGENEKISTTTLISTTSSPKISKLNENSDGKDELFNIENEEEESLGSSNHGSRLHPESISNSREKSNSGIIQNPRIILNPRNDADTLKSSKMAIEESETTSRLKDLISNQRSKDEESDDDDDLDDDGDEVVKKLERKLKKLKPVSSLSGRRKRK